jgi:hypothetical protein
MRICKLAGRWVWHCTLCHPPTIGSTWSWAKTLANAQRHCHRNRCLHHAYVTRHLGGWYTPGRA